MLIATLIFILICISNANLGVDMYQSFNNYKCMMESGYTFLITRAYRSLGEVDYIGVNNLKAAKEAGMITDVYFFPCKDKKSTTQQVQEFLEVYSIVKDDYGTVWVDVEENPSTSCAWSTTDYQSNCEFLTELVATLKAFNQLVGIYASKHQWEVIFGSATACSNFTSLPLWYAHYDQIPSFADYSKYSFGGWTKPSIKQYSGGTSICGAWVDADFY